MRKLVGNWPDVQIGSYLREKKYTQNTMEAVSDIGWVRELFFSVWLSFFTGGDAVRDYFPHLKWKKKMHQRCIFFPSLPLLISLGGGIHFPLFPTFDEKRKKKGKLLDFCLVMLAAVRIRESVDNFYAPEKSPPFKIGGKKYMISHPKETFCVPRLLPLNGRNMCENGFNCTKRFFCLCYLSPNNVMRMWIRFFFAPAPPKKKPRRQHNNFPSPCFLLLSLLFSFMARFFLWRQGRRKGASFVDPRKRRRNGVYDNNIQFPRRLAQKGSQKSNIRRSFVLPGLHK